MPLVGLLALEGASDGDGLGLGGGLNRLPELDEPLAGRFVGWGSLPDGLVDWAAAMLPSGTSAAAAITVIS